MKEKIKSNKWKCLKCGTVVWSGIDRPIGEKILAWCYKCQEDTMQKLVRDL